MSLILEALKKVEKDKSRDLGKEKLDIAILQPEGRTKRSRAVLIACVAFSAAALVAAGAGISWFLSAGTQAAKPAPAAVLPVAKPAAPAPVAPAPAGLVASAPAAPAPAEAVPAAAKPEKPAEPAPVPARPAVKVRTPAAEKPPGAAEPRRKAEKPVRTGSAPAESPHQEDSAPVSIGGIIWSQESERRRALVNGSTVKEGDEIDGLRVERIESSRIHFSRNGKKFSVIFR